VSYDWIIGLAAVAFGGFLAVYCPWSVLGDFRSGVSKGRVNNFRRDRNPVAFWLTIGATAFAGIVGVAFFVFGLLSLGIGAGYIR
jgi:hypothetical protein